MLYSVQYMVYSVQYMVYSVQYMLYSVQYMVYSVHYRLYSIQCTMCTVHTRQKSGTLWFSCVPYWLFYLAMTSAGLDLFEQNPRNWTVQCTVYSVQCTVYSVQCTPQ